MISSIVFYRIGEEEGICFVLGIDYFLSDQMKVTTVTAFKCMQASYSRFTTCTQEIIVVAEVTVVLNFFAGVPSSF